MRLHLLEYAGLFMLYITFLNCAFSLLVHVVPVLCVSDLLPYRSLYACNLEQRF